ncbi:MAG: hypothetical protein ABI321_03985 [Polyangia bacterium]
MKAAATPRLPLLQLSGPVMRDHYQVASLTLAFARGTALGRESCWALALGAATLASCTLPDAKLSLERGERRSELRLRLYGRWTPDSELTVAQTVAHLRDLGFRTHSDDDALIQLES